MKWNKTKLNSVHTVSSLVPSGTDCVAGTLLCFVIVIWFVGDEIFLTNERNNRLTNSLGVSISK